MNKFITLLFAIFFTMWTIRLYYKLYDNKTRRYILFIGILIVFWMLIRIIRGVTIDINIKRICWYLYYLPLIFIPTLFYVCSNSLLSKMNKTRKIFIYLISSILLYDPPTSIRIMLGFISWLYTPFTPSPPLVIIPLLISGILLFSPVTDRPS